MGLVTETTGGKVKTEERDAAGVDSEGRLSTAAEEEQVGALMFFSARHTEITC